MYVDRRYEKLMETKKRAREMYAKGHGQPGTLFYDRQVLLRQQQEKVQQVPSNFQLYRQYQSTYNEICRMPRQKRKWFEKNDAGYRWMCWQTMKYIWVGLLIVSIFAALFQMNY
ncbi:hypothetical protein [uncultured Duncaniella sp.]|uniref:hypothetical protein n=2 Tax=uncultured Duncaniella sp. TaxID=2768039 RepID=UPI0026361026|nr:hypothetical protein [uncultured Duncaniella sp.]